MTGILLLCTNQLASYILKIIIIAVLSLLVTRWHVWSVKCESCMERPEDAPGISCITSGYKLQYHPPGKVWKRNSKSQDMKVKLFVWVSTYQININICFYVSVSSFNFKFQALISILIRFMFQFLFKSKLLGCVEAPVGVFLFSYWYAVSTKPLP